ncbi:MAG: translation initiation factor 2 [Parasporobacterium sp.]|nr:translation initiation factor 2 [Parasporobacterium sp.]
MKMYNKKCPLCGHLNKNLYLEETDGWMECEKCHHDVKVMRYVKGICIPDLNCNGIIEPIGAA